MTLVEQKTDAVIPAGEPSVEDRLLAIRNRTPEEIAEVRYDLRKYTRPARRLPEGVSLEEIIVGSLTDDRPEEKVIAAINDL